MERGKENREERERFKMRERRQRPPHHLLTFEIKCRLCSPT